MKTKKLLLAVLCPALLMAAGAVQSAEKIKVGLMTSLSGSQSTLGAEVRDGFLLGIQHSGNQVGGRDVEVIIADDQLDPQIGRQTADRFIRRDKVDFMTGVIGSNVLLPILPFVLGSDTIYLSPNTGPADYAGAKCHKNFFAVAWQNEDVPQAVGAYATEKNFKRVAIIAPTYPGGRESVAGFKRGYTGNITEEIYTKVGQVDYASELSTLRASEPDAIFFFLPGGMGVSFIKQFAASGMAGDVALLAPGFSADIDTIQAVGDQMLGLRNTSQWAADLDNPANKRFVEDFTKTYGRIPTMFASQGYDTARLLDGAVRQVNGNLEDKDALRAAIKKADFESVRGEFKFNKNNYPIQDIYVREVVRNEDGQLANKLIGTVLHDHADRFVDECQM